MAPVVLVHCSMVSSRAAKSKVSDYLRLYSAAIVDLNSLLLACNEWPISFRFSFLNSKSGAVGVGAMGGGGGAETCGAVRLKISVFSFFFFDG